MGNNCGVWISGGDGDVLPRSLPSARGLAGVIVFSRKSYGIAIVRCGTLKVYLKQIRGERSESYETCHSRQADLITLFKLAQ